MFRPEFYVKHHKFINLAMTAYAETHRMYHTNHHLFSMIERYEDFIRRGITDFDEIMLLAIIAHDIVYDPKSSFNEEESAEIVGMYLNKRHLDGDLASEYVMKTKQHIIEDVSSDIIIDLDLWGLGSPKDVYRLNSAGIRFEYAHVPQDDWMEGRINWLTSFLKRDRLFATDYAMRVVEETARRNMQEELKSLVH